MTKANVFIKRPEEEAPIARCRHVVGCASLRWLVLAGQEAEVRWFCWGGKGHLPTATTKTRSSPRHQMSSVSLRCAGLGKSPDLLFPI